MLSMKQSTSSLEQRIVELENQVEKLQSRNQYLEELFRLAQHKKFGASSEAHSGQGELFDEAESVDEVAEETTQAPAEQDVIRSYKRNKPKRKPLPANLPRETVVLDLAEEDKICDCCGHALHQIGEDRAEKLEFVPAKVKVIETVRPKYACRQCEKQDDGSREQSPIKQASVAPAIIPKGIATPSLLSQIITSKYQYSLPLYRQEALFMQHGIELSRKTMADWVLKCAEALVPFCLLLRQILLKQPVVHADETTVKVLKEDKSTCYMWVYCTGADSPEVNHPLPNIVLYDYQNSRRGQCVVDFLDGFTQYLQVDGYVGYHQTQAILVGCWAHTRRKFMEAKQAAANGKQGKADMALSFIQKLYRIETQTKDKTPQEKQLIRQQQARPILDKFKQWLYKSSIQVLPKSKLGEAINYNLNQWHKLIRYIDDGLLNIDNNRAERAVKPFVIGRKNWMFSNTPRGAQASANLYSVIETAKANGLMPFDYLTMLFTELPKRKPADDLTDLLPWSIVPNEIESV